MGKTKRLIAYYRVSTKRQGESRLGLEAQQEAVRQFVEQEGSEVIGQYVEIETGKRQDRPELSKAVAHAKRSKATLVVAKLDRLARNVAFTSALMETNVDFVACDNPHANRFTIHILAAVAEHEAEQISKRTKDALAAAKRRGVKLGSSREGHWEGREDRRKAGAMAGAKAATKARQKAAQEAYEDILPTIQEWREQGETLQGIADRLNDLGHTTRRGASWSPTQVSRLLHRTISNT